MKDSIKMFDKMIDFALQYPDASPDRVLVINIKKETFEKILSPARMNIIRAVKETKPKTVKELASYLKRPLESVSRDLGVLESYGILEFIRHGKTKTPKIEKKMILIPLVY